MQTGKQPTRAPVWSAGVVGTACRKGKPGYPGRPAADEGRGLAVASRRRSGRASDRVMVPLRPGNAGGGKDPDFWRASEGEEEG